MKRIVKVVLTISIGAVLLGAAVSAPHALRRLDSFRVRRVQVFGTHFLAPDEALRLSGITRSANVFDDFAPWASALEKHPLVAHVRIERELPGTLRVFIDEEQPIAFTAGAGAGELRAVSATGRILPIDPTSVDLDLPVVAAPAPAPSGFRNALAVLARVKSAEPAMYGWISEVQPQGADEVIVRLRSPAGVEALLPAAADAARLRQLRTALADLAAKQDINRILRIDARYRDQIVVALTPKAAS